MFVERKHKGMGYTVLESFTDRMDPYFVALCAKLEKEEIAFHLTPQRPSKKNKSVVLGVPTHNFERAQEIYTEVKHLSLESLDLLRQRALLNARTQDLLARSQRGKFRLDRISIFVVIFMIVIIAIAFLLVR